MSMKTRTLHVQRGTRWRVGDSVPSYTQVGGYPVYYVTEDCDPVCPGCVKRALNAYHDDRIEIEAEVLGSLLEQEYSEEEALRDARITARKEAYKGVAWDVRIMAVNWESRLNCEVCGGRIGSAYPPPR